MNWNTSLQLTNVETGLDVVFPPGSDRGISEQLKPVGGAVTTRRDVNGGLVVMTNPLFRKIVVELSADDMALPGLSDEDLGGLYTVACLTRLTQPVVAGSASLPRDPVPGSVFATGPDGAPVASSVVGRAVSAPGAASLSFRPLLQCALSGLDFESDEMAAEAGWSIVLEEL